MLYKCPQLTLIALLAAPLLTLAIGKSNSRIKSLSGDLQITNEQIKSGECVNRGFTTIHTCGLINSIKQKCSTQRKSNTIKSIM